jgi:hypothetical protein
LNYVDANFKIKNISLYQKHDVRRERSRRDEDKREKREK